jgi:hypothetical protein
MFEAGATRGGFLFLARIERRQIPSIYPFGFRAGLFGEYNFHNKSGYLPRQQPHFQFQSCTLSSGSFEGFQIHRQYW